MPNYCTNKLVISGEPVECKKFWEIVKSDKQELEFNKILPMPIELEGSKSSMDSDYKENEQTKKWKELYGFCTWDEWRMSKWSNSHDCYWCFKDDDKENELTYTTSWAPAKNIIHYLSKMFPALKITNEYEIENMCGKGILIGYKGLLVDIPLKQIEPVYSDCEDEENLNDEFEVGNGDNNVVDDVNESEDSE